MPDLRSVRLQACFLRRLADALRKQLARPCPPVAMALEPVAASLSSDVLDLARAKAALAEAIDAWRQREQDLPHVHADTRRAG